ncbi:myoD family inhibitor domain-containing protein 2-like isoform X1 [Xenopus tropicalis]|uniref:MyoD family inhibitor domain-containing protein 2-like isoform X1 n=1 Tax=Xenopus tropicalis TaxID=8364 RepID=A0A8J1IQZ9_XENTR|nr:myoD family inhibitor domain-containing protein 2-like isoform X1 [Xenopus tropicalis]
MSEGHPGTPGNLPAISGGARISAEPPETPGDTEENDPRGARLSPEPTCPKHQNRGSSRRKKTQGPKLSARHIEQAAGDVSDLSASLLLACLFCHFSDCLVLLPGTCDLGLRCLCCSQSPSSCLSAFPDLCCCLSPSACSNTDCGCLDMCQHTAECLEFAMEVSELCYR